MSVTDCVVQAAGAVRLQRSEGSVCWYGWGRHQKGYEIQHRIGRKKELSTGREVSDISCTSPPAQLPLSQFSD